MTKQDRRTEEPNDNYGMYYKSHDVHMDSKHGMDSKRDMDSKDGKGYEHNKDSEPTLQPPSYDVGHVSHSSDASSSHWKSKLYLMISYAHMYQ